MTIRTSAVLAPLVLLSTLLSGCGEGSSMQKGFEDGLKTKFVEEFTKSCEGSAAGSGAPADKIAEVCKCTADGIAEKYDASDLMSLSPEKATPVMKECAAKAGLPI